MSVKDIINFCRAQVVLVMTAILTLGFASYSLVFTNTAFAAAYGGCGDCSIVDENSANLIWAYGNASPNYIYDSTNDSSNNGAVNVVADPICPGDVVSSQNACPFVSGSGQNAAQNGKQLVYISYRIVGGGNCAYSTSGGFFDINAHCNTVSEAFELIDNGHQLISVGATNYLYNKIGNPSLYAYACGQNASNTKLIWTADTNGDCHWNILKLAH
jgi:hypothetical protein